MPIIIAPTGRKLKIVKIMAEAAAAARDYRLEVGTVIVVLMHCGSKLICEAEGGRIALDEALATKILVA